MISTFRSKCERFAGFPRPPGPGGLACLCGLRRLVGEIVKNGDWLRPHAVIPPRNEEPGGACPPVSLRFVRGIRDAESAGDRLIRQFAVAHVDRVGEAGVPGRGGVQSLLGDLQDAVDAASARDCLRRLGFDPDRDAAAIGERVLNIFAKAEAAPDGTVRAFIPGLGAEIDASSVGEGVTADAAGNVYMAETGGMTVRKFLRK